MAKDIEVTGGHLSERLKEKMEEKGMSLRDVSVATEHTYEMIRKLSRGEAFPSRFLVLKLSEALDWNKTEIEKLAVADRIRHKYGKIPALLSNKNPELEPLEKVWNHLSETHKEDLIAQANAWAKRDKRENAAARA